MNRALFLDRDGVINEDYGYVHKIEDFHFRDGIFDVCRAAQMSRMLIVVVTNQSGIGRGFYRYEDFQAVIQYMRSTFSNEGVLLSGVYHCPHHPTHGLGHYRKSSYDRKPSPGMLVQACNDLNINPGLSVFIGDNESDREAACRICVKQYVDASQYNWIDSSLEAIRLYS
jgi:D-glycero-D-manno-heptose 1,7-bisphosphate phosphatase